jgi:hypothetical protein
MVPVRKDKEWRKLLYWTPCNYDGDASHLLSSDDCYFIKPNTNISLSDLEGVQHAQINLRSFQLIVDLFLIPHEGAHAVPITHYSASEGDQSLSSATVKPSHSHWQLFLFNG